MVPATMNFSTIVVEVVSLAVFFLPQPLQSTMMTTITTTAIGQRCVAINSHCCRLWPTTIPDKVRGEGGTTMTAFIEWQHKHKKAHHTPYLAMFALHCGKQREEH
jgi:hypothetical protein